MNNMDALKVQLDSDTDKALRDFIYTLITDTVTKARRDASLDKDFLNKKSAIEFSGLGYQRFSKLVRDGVITAHTLDTTVLFSKKEIEKVILEH